MILVYIFFLILNLIKTKNVAFMGASVTQQNPGYVSEFRMLNPSWNITQYGVGLMLVNVCKLDFILESKPEILFIDFSLHGNGTELIQIIETLVYRLAKENVTPVFIHFPRTDNVKLNVIKYIDNLSEKLNFSVFDLRKLISKAELENILLRDFCHTNLAGAKRYAFEINSLLQKETLKKPIDFEIPNKSLAYLKHYPVNSQIFSNITFSINGRIFGIEHKKGPYSNYINMVINNNLSRKLLLWDSNCFHDRTIMIQDNFLQKQIIGSLRIDILNENFNRTNCRRNVSWKWEDFTPVFNLIEVCYSGSLELVKIDQI